MVKLAQVIRDCAGSLLEALSGSRSLCAALQTIQRRMRSGCHMNKRKKHPNSAQLLQRGSTDWALDPSVGAYGGKHVGTPSREEQPSAANVERLQIPVKVPRAPTHGLCHL